MRWVLFAATLLPALCTVEELPHLDSVAKQRARLLAAEIRRLHERIHTLEGERSELESDGLWHGVKGGLGRAGDREEATNVGEGQKAASGGEKQAGKGQFAPGNRIGRRRREESEGVICLLGIFSCWVVLI